MEAITYTLELYEAISGAYGLLLSILIDRICTPNPRILQFGLRHDLMLLAKRATSAKPMTAASTRALPNFK